MTKAKRSKDYLSDPRSARSDDLVDLRQIRRAASEYLRIDSVGPPVVLNFVVDANQVLQHLGYVARERRNPSARASTQEVADAGMVRLFGPFWLAEEVDLKIPAFAERREINESLLRAAWKEYRPQLHLFRADPVAEIDDVVDSKDLPYAYAQWHLGADAVVTEDPHLLRSRVPTLPTKLTHKTLRDYVRQRAVSDSIAVVGSGAVGGGIAVTGKAVIELGKAVAKRPWLAVLALAAGGGLAWWSNKRKAETGESPLAAVARELGSAAGRLADAYREASQEADANMKAIRDQIGFQARTLTQWVLTTCIVVREAILEADLIERMKTDGFYVARADSADDELDVSKDARAARAQRLAYEVGQILRTDPRFHWTGTGWTTHLLQPPPGPLASARPSEALSALRPAEPLEDARARRVPSPESKLGSRRRRPQSTEVVRARPPACAVANKASSKRRTGRKR